MSTRWRIFLAAVLLIVTPVGLLAGLYRQRFRTQAVTTFADQTSVDLERALAVPGQLSVEITAQLDLLIQASRDDNRLRLALVGGRDDLRPYLRDHAGRVARTTSLDVLQLMDAEGRILSSAHYRNEFGRLEPALLQALTGGETIDNRRWRAPLLLRHGPVAPVPLPPAPDSGFLVDHEPDGPLLVYVARRGFSLGGEVFHWLGGRRVAGAFDRHTDVRIVTADTTLFGPSSTELVAWTRRADAVAWGQRQSVVWDVLDVPLVENGRLVPAQLVTQASRTGLDRQLRRLDLTLAGTLTAALAGAFLLAAWLAGRLSRPLADLARRATSVDLDDPGAVFHTDRRDEVGKLARVLDAMVHRLREDAQRLADAEHRATLGEVARQVNHDLRNGITPVRNVVRHLGETAEREPARLAEVFAERHGTLQRSLDYLDDLAGRYARLAPESRRESCDLGAIAREAATMSGEVTLSVAPDAPAILADPIALRRILDNLVRNALDALPDRRGTIAVTVSRNEDPDLGRQCRLSVQDTGVGMTPEVQARIFEDFFTTKNGGTGLGLSNVRRLAGDAGGRLEIVSAPGEGTTVTIIFPAAEVDA